jgi:hypothetical protein
LIFFIKEIGDIHILFLYNQYRMPNDGNITLLRSGKRVFFFPEGQITEDEFKSICAKYNEFLIQYLSKENGFNLMVQLKLFFQFVILKNRQFLVGNIGVINNLKGRLESFNYLRNVEFNKYQQGKTKWVTELLEELYNM